MPHHHRPARGPIAIFLHVATLGRYQEVADEMLLALARHRLLDSAAHVQISIVGEGPFVQGFAHPAVQVVRASPHVTAFEHPTLSAMAAYGAAMPDARILYLNCLGGRYEGEGWEIRREWRRLLAYLLIERQAHCLEALETHDVCGVSWCDEPLPHMTSNNWWATGAYLAGLPTMAEAEARLAHTDLSRYGHRWCDAAVKRRHSGEFWIGMDQQVRAHPLFDLNTLGFVRGEFNSVAWWALPGIEWTAVARRRLERAGDPMTELRFQRARLAANARQIARHGKRAVTGWLPARVQAARREPVRV